MNRLLLTLLAGTALVAAAASSLAQDALGPRLKSLIVVEGDTIRLGDLIDGAGAAGAKVVFRAPEPGQSGTIRADRVAAAARDHGIELDTQKLQNVTVRRSGRTISAEEIARAVTAALARDHGVTVDNEVELLAGTTEFVVEADTIEPVVVTALTYNPTQQRFEATLTVPGSALAGKLQPKVIGGVTDIARVPRLSKAILRGETLTAEHVVWERRRRGELPADLVTDPQRFISHVARRALGQGQIIRESDVSKPELVERNATVLMLYEQPGLTLTLRGKALAGGSAGDTVQVQNTQTKKIIEAMVVGAGRVRVLSAGETGPARQSESRAESRADNRPNTR